MVTLHYKIVFGYEPENYIPIEVDELEKAIYAHMTLSRAAFKEGSVDFSRGGIMIQPDFNKAMGWNRGYKLGADDYAELAQTGADRLHERNYAKVKERVEYLKSTNKTDLIGKNVPLPELDKPRNENRGEGMKRIRDITPPKESEGK